MPKIGETKVGETGTQFYIGIDPGASGGLAVIRTRLSPNGPELYSPPQVTAIKMPETPRDIWDWIRQGSSTNTFAVIEKVGGFVKGNPVPGSAMFNFGKGAGWLEMALIGAWIPYEEAMPQKWQKALGIPPKKKDETKTAWKNRLKKKAQQLFPTLAAGSITLATADALLIATYCQRLREGKL